MPETTEQYDEYLSIRLHGRDKKLLQDRAEAAGKTLGEWSRDVLLSTVTFTPDYRLLLAEFMAMRKFVLELHLHLIQNSEPPSDETVRALAHEAETNKFKAADRRILAYIQE